jgi:hypothetical protein
LEKYKSLEKDHEKYRMEMEKKVDEYERKISKL